MQPHDFMQPDRAAALAVGIACLIVALIVRALSYRGRAERDPPALSEEMRRPGS